MSEPKLKPFERDVIRLFQRSPVGPDGWSKVSDQVWPHIQGMPKELVELEPMEIGGRGRLTEAAKTLLEWI